MTQYSNGPIDRQVYDQAIARAHELRAQAIGRFFAGLGQRLARSLSFDLSHRGTPKAAH